MKDTNLTKSNNITLREISMETVDSICELTVLDEQKQFVASNAESIAYAYFSKDTWIKAVYYKEDIAGFMMVYKDKEDCEYFLWRFMIDSRFQSKGIGKKAIEILIDDLKSKNDGYKELYTTVVEGEGGPKGFYEKLGFKISGDYIRDEAVMTFDL